MDGFFSKGMSLSGRITDLTSGNYVYLEAHLAFYFDPFDFGLLFQSFQKKKVTGIRKRSFTVLIQMINTQWLPTNDVLAPYGLDRLLPLLHL